ncbi:MAG: GNAT family N-acetyltransferase [Chloroflexota bacterium]
MIGIRPAEPMDAATIADIHVRSWRAQFTAFLTPEQIMLKNLDQHDIRLQWQSRLVAEEGQRRHTFIACDGGMPVGYITGRTQSPKAGYSSELDQIYVLASHLGLGIGTQLVSQLVARLMSIGHTSMMVWVMTTNPAVQFYRERLGGVYLGERVIPDGDGILKEAGYGWDDMGALRKQLSLR